MPRKSSMSKESKAIVDYLRKFGATNRTELNSAMSGQTATEVTKRLNNLSISGWVRFSPVYRTWEISPSAQGMFPSLDAFTQRKAVKQARESLQARSQEPANLVPARTFNFHGTNYVPPSFTPARQGALDLGQVPSRGQRC